ncbi:hypothetical protein ACIBCT_06840 [Streptosporangium sp. NPDC050855]|uniref:hypothetical protein n=1 Tax=Streptosporangium sp. NPDC050855 TaxID=3366194 RepID=UPI00378E8B29
MSLLLEFFGLTVLAVTHIDSSEMAFLFGSHLVKAGKPQLTVKLVSNEASGGELLVHREDGVLLQRRAFRGWGTMPPPVPPFGVLEEHFLVMRAVVLAKGDATVALIGSACSPCAEVAVSLAAQSWRPVSGQLLVVDRATGHTLPFLTPLNLRGEALDAARASGLIGLEADPGLWRPARPTLAGQSVLVRPERLGTPVPITARLAPPTLIRLCQGDSDRCRLEPSDFQAHVWPPAATELAGAPRYRLRMPESGGAEAAAALIDDRLLKEFSCPGGSRTALEHPAGSITSPSTRPARNGSTVTSSAGSSSRRTAGVTT